LFLLFTFFLINAWTLDPLGAIIFLNEGIGIDFTSTFFKSSLALLKVGCVVLRSNDGDENDKGGYDTNKDTLDLHYR
jgi:hypothetical protein